MNNVSNVNRNVFFNTKSNSNLSQNNFFNKNKNSIGDSTTIKTNSKSTNSLISSLQKNIEQLEKQKESLKDQKLDPKELLEKSQKVEDEIKKINAQIQQAMFDQKKADAEKLEEEIKKKKLEEEKYTKNGDEIRDDVIISSSLKVLIEANSSKNTYHKLKELKARYEFSNPEIAKKIDSAILKELGKVDKLIKNEQKNTIIKLKNSEITNEVNDKTEKNNDKNNTSINSDTPNDSDSDKTQKQKDKE